MLEPLEIQGDAHGVKVKNGPRETAPGLKRKLPVLSDEVAAEAVVRLFLHQTEAGPFVDVPRGVDPVNSADEFSSELFLVRRAEGRRRAQTEVDAAGKIALDAQQL